MDYSQFFNMLPEATLMAVLVIVFLADMMVGKESKHKVLSILTGVLMLAQTGVCLVAESSEAFSGMYVATDAVNVMKIILTAGTFIVIAMAQPWLTKKGIADTEGEFYMLIISTLLGMYMMMSAGHFLLFFLGLEMASVPMACLVALDRYRKESAEGAPSFFGLKTIQDCQP